MPNKKTKLILVYIVLIVILGFGLSGKKQKIKECYENGHTSEYCNSDDDSFIIKALLYSTCFLLIYELTRKRKGSK